MVSVDFQEQTSLLYTFITARTHHKAPPSCKSLEKPFTSISKKKKKKSGEHMGTDGIAIVSFIISRRQVILSPFVSWEETCKRSQIWQVSQRDSILGLHEEPMALRPLYSVS